MGLIGKILITVTCVLLSFFSFRIGRRKQEYEPHADTLENEKRYSAKVMGHFCGFLFLLPLVSCWAPKWAEAHHWDLCYAILMLLVLVLLVIPKIREEEDADELKKRSNNHDDYKSAG